MPEATWKHGEDHHYQEEAEAEVDLEEPSRDEVIGRFRGQDSPDFYTRYPEAREVRREVLEDEGSRGEAAVLIPLVLEKDRWKILMTVRSLELRSQGGRVAFPGGKKDEGDADLLTTALRETQEEIGLPPQQVEVLSQLPPVIGPNLYLVTPFIGIVRPDCRLKPDPAEVSAIFTAPAQAFLRREHFSSRSFEFRGHNHVMPTINVMSSGLSRSPYSVVGMTARLAIIAAAVLYQRRPSFSLGPPLDVMNISKYFQQAYFRK